MGPTQQQAEPVEQYAPIERPINIHGLMVQKRGAQFRVTDLGALTSYGMVSEVVFEAEHWGNFFAAGRFGVVVAEFILPELE
jgi:hypothetical protein